MVVFEGVNIVFDVLGLLDEPVEFSLDGKSKLAIGARGANNADMTFGLLQRY